MRKSIWCFLIKWWSWIVRLIEFPESINICFIHGFGKKWISWIHLNFSLFARTYSPWSCFHGLIVPYVLNSCPTKLIFRSEKEGKKMPLLPICIWLLNHKNWDKTADGTNVWHENLLPQVLIISLEYFGKLFVNYLFTFKLEWNTNFFANDLRIIWSGSIFQSWKFSSNNLFIQELWRLLFLAAILTLFNPPFS